MTKKKSPQQSPALHLVEHVWRSKMESIEHSWTRVNHAMHTAVKLAIDAGLRFDPDDFGAIYREMRGSYWFGVPSGEQFYSKAAAMNHTSACQSFEKFADRPPFLFRGNRLAIGSELTWDGQTAKVTSFSHNDALATDRLTACIYKLSSGKVIKRLTIGVQDLRDSERRRKKAGGGGEDPPVQAAKLLSKRALVCAAKAGASLGTSDED